MYLWTIRELRVISDYLICTRILKIYKKSSKLIKSLSSFTAFKSKNKQ